MKKRYLSKSIFLFICLIFSTTINSIEIQESNIKPNDYVILIGTFEDIKDARGFINKFQDENIFILKDKKLFTVRIVNIETKEKALEKLSQIKKIVPDAILWKKMLFINNKEYDKFHSQIYTINSNEDSKD